MSQLPCSCGPCLAGALMIATGYTTWAAQQPCYEPAALQLWPLWALILPNAYPTLAAQQPLYEPAALQLCPLPCRGLNDTLCLPHIVCTTPFISASCSAVVAPALQGPPYCLLPTLHRLHSSLHMSQLPCSCAPALQEPYCYLTPTLHWLHNQIYMSQLLCSSALLL